MTTITYEVLPALTLEDTVTTPVHIKVKGKLTKKTSEQDLGGDIIRSLRDEGLLYFILDLRECESIVDETLKTIILEQWPLNSYMGRIITLLDKEKNSEVSKVFEDCNFYGVPPYKPIFAFFDSLDKALEWIPRDRSRRLALRKEKEEGSK